MPVELSNDTLLPAQIAQHDKVIVKYFADWCGSCKLFSPKYKRLSAEERFADITFITVNAEENPESRKLGGVDNLPFFATFKNGQLLKAKSTSKEESVVDMLTEL